MPNWRSFLPHRSISLPASYNSAPTSQTWRTESLWATTARSATFPSVQNDLRAPPAQRDDGDRHALPSRHRRSQAATTPAIVTAWQATYACVSPMASVCCAPDAAALLRKVRSILSKGRELGDSAFAIAIETTYNPISINCKTSIPQLKRCVNRLTVIK